MLRVLSHSVPCDFCSEKEEVLIVLSVVGLAAQSPSVQHAHAPHACSALAES